MCPVKVEGATLCGPVQQLSPRMAPEGLPPHLSRLFTAHAGRDLVAPLRRPDGTMLLAILGWVPADAPLPPLPPPASVLTGVLRRTSEPSVWGVPQGSSSGGGGGADPATPPAAPSGVHAFLNTHTLAEACGLSAARGDIVDAVVEVVQDFPVQGTPGNPWPVTRQRGQLESASLAPPYTHLVYAATWAALTVFGGLATLRRARGGLGRGGLRRLAAASKLS